MDDTDDRPEMLEKLAAALAKAQGQMGAATKDATNPHFGSRYASFAAIWEACRAPLAENGIAVVQQVSCAPGGVTVVTTLIHSSGQHIGSACWLPVAQNTPQAYGSAITYAKRYGLSALVGVVADDDDDGNAASAPAPVQQRRERPPRRTEEVREQLAKVAPDAVPVDEPGEPRILFGGLKGTLLAELTGEQLASALQYGKELLAAKPNAPSAPKMRAQLKDLEAETARRATVEVSS